MVMVVLKINQLVLKCKSGKCVHYLVVEVLDSHREEAAARLLEYLHHA